MELADNTIYDQEDESYCEADEAEESEACECLFNDLIQDLERDMHGQSFYPFPNKLFALLYLLLHTPHQMVHCDIHVYFDPSIFLQGETNMSFVWFILKRMGIATPSLNSIKAFQLPGVSVPKRVQY